MVYGATGRKKGDLELQGWLVRIFKRMFREVGEVFDEEYVREPGWYLKREWTQRQQEDFSIWLYYSLKKQHPWKYMPEDKLREQVSYFILNYGWKVKNEGE